MSFAGYEQIFGGLTLDAAGDPGALRFAVRDFFFNGGSDAIVVRLDGSGGKAASLTLGGVLTLNAASNETWGNALFARADTLNARDATNPKAAPKATRFLRCGAFSRSGGFSYLTTSDLGAPLGVKTAVYNVARPTSDEQRRVWESRLGPDGSGVAARLVSQFNLDAATIATIVRRETQVVNRDGIERRLWDAYSTALRPELHSLAQRLETKATWDDLVLPDHQLGLLRQIAAQLSARHQVYEGWGFGAKMNHGFGATALFAGEAGRARP